MVCLTTCAEARTNGKTDLRHTRWNSAKPPNARNTFESHVTRKKCGT